MKKYCLYIIFFVLLGCSAQDKSVEIEPVCRETGCFKWTDKKQAVKYYEQLLDNVVSFETASLTYEQIDAMLYLSYIYLTDSEYKDINKAKKLMNIKIPTAKTDHCGNSITQLPPPVIPSDINDAHNAIPPISSRLILRNIQFISL